MKIESTANMFSMIEHKNHQQNTNMPPQSTDNKYVDTVSISQQGMAAFQADVMAKHEAGDVVAVADNRNKNIIATSRTEFMQTAIQATLDQRTGVDREKLDEINAMIEDIANNPNLSEEKKEELIAQLEEQKEEIIKEATERTIVEERSKEQKQLQE